MNESDLIGYDPPFLLELTNQVFLPACISTQPYQVELVDDILNGLILIDLSAGIEKVHVVVLVGGAKFEIFRELAFCRHLVFDEGDSEVNAAILMVLPQLLDIGVLICGRL